MLKTWMLLVGLSVCWIAERSRHLEVWTKSTSLQEVQAALGKPLPPHYIEPDPEVAKKGEELVKFGRTIGPNGRRTRFISKHYVCTTCHNLQQEDQAQEQQEA